jgi:predicted secreted protein
MSRFAPAMVLLFAAAAVQSGCHHDSALPAPSGSTSATPGIDAGETVVLGTADDGKTFDLPVGGSLTLRLAGHAGTGYAWVPVAQEAGDGGVLSPTGERTSEVSSDTPGAPKVDVYRLSASRAGTATVEMALRRPWGNEPPVKTWRVTVTVH